MRNLTVLNKGRIVPQSITYPDLQVIDAVFDPINDSITYCLSNEESHLIEVQQFAKTGEITTLASFPIKEFDTLLSFSHFADSFQLIFIFRQGDIVRATYDPQVPSPDSTVVEIVGSIDCGLKCASWSPDEESLAMLSMENNLLLLSRLFEPIAEKILDPKEVNLKTQVSVGWGKKETQFKGKGARAIEREKLSKEGGGGLQDPTLAIIEKGELSEYDDHSSKISWRGDCSYFAITNIETPEVDGDPRRVIRVYTRDGELESCSEAVDGLESNLSWKPQGSLIASTQRRLEEEIGEEVLDLVFFEKNGLRHGGFTSRLPPASRILKLEWSANSEVLCFQLENSIQFWTTKNYHWYLKQEILSDEPIRFIYFHQEKPLRIMIGTETSLRIIDLAYKTINGPTCSPNDIGMTCSIDGRTCLITPLALANVPPPMGYREIDCNEPLLDVSISSTNSIMACLSNTNLTLVTLDEKIQAPKIVSDFKLSEFDIISEEVRQIAVIRNDFVVILYDNEFNSKLCVLDIKNDLYRPKIITTVDVSPKIVLLKQQSDFNGVTYETIAGKVFQLTDDFESVELCHFPQLCTEYEVALKPSNEEFGDGEAKFVVFGITSNGKLFANDQQLSSAVTSLKVTEAHLIYTTAQHQIKFVHLSNDLNYRVVEDAQNQNNSTFADERVRLIERGSIIVSVIPSKLTVVLQAPRGNLESIYPRIMTLTGVRNDIKSKNYKKAFMTCRTHRIDLDILYDYDPQLFFSNLELFVNQIEKVEYLDLFVSCLHEEDATKTKYKETLNLKAENNIPEENVQSFKEKQIDPKDSKVNKICEGILSVLLKPKYKKKYLQTIITAYACERPPNLETALTLISSFTSQEDIEKTVQHLCFLQDVNRLYNVALSLYDIPLTLIVAQQSQKDPKEYLPFLQNLHVQPDLRKKFLIDTHLKNFEKALNSLTKIEDVDMEEVKEYIIDHDLYKHALSIYKDDKAKIDIILKIYAKFLHGKSEFVEAGITYEILGEYELALEDYILARRWREALTLALRPELKEKKLIESCERLTVFLTEEHKYTAAAEIEFKYLKNIEEALKLYCKDYYFETAILLCVDENKLELIEDVIDPALGEGLGVILELLADCFKQVESQLSRLRELRFKKKEDPYAFYGEDGVDSMDTPDNVSIAASETSTKESFFTRYTGKTSGTAKTGASRRTAKNKRREERKKARGKKGTIYEEEYLVKSIGRLIERLETTEPESVRLIEGLIKRNRFKEAYDLQKRFIQLLQLLKDNIQEIYNISEKDRERVDDNGMIYYLPEIPIPSIKEYPKKNILDF
ncbi:hypothetical protein PACTADRAFT_2255 [Pachysolen tannophilus NRRL Y-2460]|uniref:Elongator complex protein 1 n=1 Tax=Pachysolen tannophilus NRRL Y-2460 TaxID=669874 RepID=A0A1E4TW14_PACTA|nr:hypothetical protein PACTADRAFT_2255 [Pachysolen tannophilus NRRL Y-2460]